MGMGVNVSYTVISAELACYLYIAYFCGPDNTQAWPHCDLWKIVGKEMSFIKKTMERYWFCWELAGGVVN
jgi:hypothetical protein